MKRRHFAISLVLAAVVGLTVVILQSEGEWKILSEAHRSVASVIPKAPSGSSFFAAQGASQTPTDEDPDNRRAGSHFPPFHNPFVENHWDRAVPAYITQFKRLENRILKGEQEIAEWKAILGDRGRIEEARNFLCEIEPEAEFRREVERIEVLDYLIQAGRWPDNPNRQAVLDSMKDLITTDNVKAELPAEARQAIAGDKVELWQELYRQDPALAESVKQSVKGTPTAKLIALAELHKDELTFH